jgi:hypothetical protein
VATTVAKLEAVLSANTRDFDRAMHQSDSKMKGVAKTAGKAGLAGAVIGLGAAVKIGFDEFMQAQRVTAQTNAVLKSTGGIANVTAKQIDTMATALMRKTGVDDEVIQSGMNVLLTFTRIRNEAGKGNDIFNQATKAALDLSVALGKDLQSANILVGKALNDPLKGLTALVRVGVTFSQKQKDQIKAWLDTKDAAKSVAAAQKDVEAAQKGVASSQAAVEAASRKVAAAQRAEEAAARAVTSAQDAVRTAGDRLKDTQERVSDSTHKVADAKEKLRDAQLKAKDAQQALTDARRKPRTG